MCNCPIPIVCKAKHGKKHKIICNCTIIAVAFDSIGQAGSAATNKVTTIDRSAPTIGSITGAFTIVSGNTGTIKLTSIADVGSGLSGYHVNTTGAKPTSSSSWMSNTSSEISYSVSNTTETTYYFWVKDNAGNISEAKSCKVSVATAIAKVGDIYYSSITNAINAISSTGTITLLQNRTEDITIPSGKTITLDLNKKTLTGAGTIRIDSKYNSTIINNGTLTISNGTVNGKDWAIRNDESGKLTVNSGTYTASVYEAICPTGNSTTTITSGTFTGNNYGLMSYGGTTTVKGGTFTGNNADGIRIHAGTANIENGTFQGENFALYTDGGTLNIKGGTFNSINGLGLNSGTVTVTGGNFTGSSAGVYGVGGTMTIYGGTFTGNVYNGISNSGMNLYINGGTFQGKNFALYTDGGTTNVTNGIFNSNTGLGMNGGILNISGGTFTGTGSGAYCNSGTITITGGTFRGNTYDGFYNHGATVYVNGGNYSGKNWGISSEAGKIYYRRTDSQTSDNGLVSSQGWPAVYATDLTFY